MRVRDKLKTKFLVAIFAVLIIYGKAYSDADDMSWLKLYFMENGINRINANPIGEIDSIYYTTAKIADDETPGLVTIINVRAGNSVFSLPVDSIRDMVFGTNIPTLYVDTDPYVDEITDKEEYLTAKLMYVPYGDGSEPLEATVSIKGRGNTSWYFPKKPYRLKFDKKQALAGLNKAKSFVLLSNYIDNTLMRNAVAMKVAQLLDLPYTNGIVPVNLVFNGKQRGNYMLTNKVGINAGSVDIDENEGILWEWDSNFDEEFKFRSEPFNLPCMVSDPDFHEITDDDPGAIEELWNYWQNDLTSALEAVAEGRWQEVIDAEQFVKYILVQDIVLNGEISHPKSVYVYKENKEGKYKFGPVWDFDWAFNYNYLVEYAIMNTQTPAIPFYSKIFDDEEFLTLFREELDRFCDESLDELLQFIDDYAALIRDSAMADAMLWPAEHYNSGEKKERNASRFDENVEELKEWILTRIDLIKGSPNYKLYQN